MKKLVITICIAIVFVGFTSCKSEKQKKAEQFFSEVYSNEEGYRPIETTVEVMKSTPDHDMFCMKKADTLLYYIQKQGNLYEVGWGNHFKFINKPEDVIKDITSHNTYLDSINILKKEIRKYVRQMDSTKRIGYIITQRFETYEGNYKETCMVDKNFNLINPRFLNLEVDVECTLYDVINDELCFYRNYESDEYIGEKINEFMYDLKRGFIKL